MKSCLLSHIGEEPCFNRLRTNQQLGYIVLLGIRREQATWHIRIVVQSSTRSCTVIGARIKEFLFQLCNDVLTEMSEAEFQDNIAAAESKLLAKDLTLEQETKRWWAEIEEGSLWFDRWQHITKEMHKVSKEELIAFASLHVLGSQKRWLITGIGAHDDVAVAERRVGQDEEEPSMLDLALDLASTSPVAARKGSQRSEHSVVLLSKPSDLAEFKERSALYGAVAL